MLLILIPIAWIAVMTMVVAVCCMAARGDRVTVSSSELGGFLLSTTAAGATASVSRTPAQAPRSIAAA
jgi:hypothetical protein